MLFRSLRVLEKDMVRTITAIILFQQIRFSRYSDIIVFNKLVLFKKYTPIGKWLPKYLSSKIKNETFIYHAKILSMTIYYILKK